MTEAYERIAAVVEEVRQLAKGERGQALQLVLGDLSEVVEASVRLAKCDERTRAHTITLELGDLPRFQFDVGRMKQVLLNLIRNASDSMAERGEIEITSRWDDAERRVWVSIRDTGCGIEPEFMAKMWEPFVTTKGLDGTGLGLDLCRCVIEAHGGYIHCESEPGNGSTFIFVLPAR